MDAPNKKRGSVACSPICAFGDLKAPLQKFAQRSQRAAQPFLQRFLKFRHAAGITDKCAMPERSCANIFNNRFANPRASYMRQIVLDTETTGLEPSQGHRIIEIGCVEIVNRRVSSRHYHQYINPLREIDAGAAEVHGMTLDDLREKPEFREIASEFVEFVRGAELIIHNAPFDVGFLDAELKLLGTAWGTTTDYCSIFDTLKLARETHPGQRNSLDALCRRYEINNAHRELHGALLDAELLAEVYLAMTGGQGALELDSGRAGRASNSVKSPGATVARDLVIVSPQVADIAAHHQTLERIDASSAGACIWLKPGA